MLTKREKEWLISHYMFPRILSSFYTDPHLTDVESALILKGLAMVKPRNEHRPTTSIRDMYVLPSSLGEGYIMEHALLDLLFYMADMHQFRSLEQLIRELPMEKLPGLLVCTDGNIRYWATQEMKRRGNVNR